MKSESKRSELARLRIENKVLRQIAADLQWMARRYADGRRTYATAMLNEITRTLLLFGVTLNPTGDEILFARDGGGRAFDGLSEQEAIPGTLAAKGIKDEA